MQSMIFKKSTSKAGAALSEGWKIIAKIKVGTIKT
jgi:hypothetical protein